MGSLQYYFVLSVNLVGVEKVKKTKKEGGFRNLGKVPPAAKGAPKVARKSGMEVDDDISL